MPILITLKKLSPMSYCLTQRISHKIAYVISTKRLLNAIYMVSCRNASRFSYSATTTITAQKMKFYIKDFFSKCAQIRRKLRIWSHLLKKSLMQNFIFCAVHEQGIIRKPRQMGLSCTW